jgi:thiol-disulfide isomerase/thioredoxin
MVSREIWGAKAPFLFAVTQHFLPGVNLVSFSRKLIVLVWHPMDRSSFPLKNLMSLALVVSLGCSKHAQEPISPKTIEVQESAKSLESSKNQDTASAEAITRTVWGEEDLVSATPEHLSKWISQQSSPLVLVDFWATFCPTCVAKLPKVGALSEKYADGRLAVVAISCDDLSEMSSVLQILNRTKPSFPQWIVPDGAYQANVAFDMESLPTYRLFNNRGELIEQFSGEFEFEDVEKRIEAELAK